ncbi:hypothetical protein Psyaliredsea_25680 [Psychrobacter alimentarius]
MTNTMNKESENLRTDPVNVTSNDMNDKVDTRNNVAEDSVDIAKLRTPIKVDLSFVYDFLGARTTQSWVDAAIANLPLIIQDHANCEKRRLVLQ